MQKDRLFREMGAAITVIADGMANEGDRVYFGSTNDADWLKELSTEYNDYRDAEQLAKEQAQ